MLRLIAHTYHLSVALLLMLLPLTVFAQEVEEGERVPLARSRREGRVRVTTDSLVVDTLHLGNAILTGIVDSVQRDDEYIQLVGHQDSSVVRFSLNADSLQKYVNPKVKGRFIPDPKKALWLAIVIPGGWPDL